MLSMLQEAVKALKSDDLLHLYNLVLDNVETDVAVSYEYKLVHMSTTNGTNLHISRRMNI